MIPCFTDNHGSGSELIKLMTNKYPSRALACHLKRMSIKEWSTGLPAPPITRQTIFPNGTVGRFDAANRIVFKESGVLWICFRRICRGGVRWSGRASGRAHCLVVCQIGHDSRGSESWRTRCVSETRGNLLRKRPRQLFPRVCPAIQVDWLRE